MTAHIPWIIVGAIVGIFSAGFTVGVFAGKYVTKQEFKEHELRNQTEVDKLFDKISQLFDKIEDLRVDMATARKQ